LYADATKVQANAAVSSPTPRFAVEAHLNTLFPAKERQEQKANESVPSTDAALLASSQIEGSAADDQGLHEAQEAVTLPRQLHPSLEPERFEAFARVNSERHDWIEQAGEPMQEMVRGNYQRIADLQVSRTDPDATLMQTKGGARLGYHTHYVVDGGKARTILQALVTPSEVMENQPVLDLLWRAHARWKLRPRQFDFRYHLWNNG